MTEEDVDKTHRQSEKDFPPLDRRGSTIDNFRLFQKSSSAERIIHNVFREKVAPRMASLRSSTSSKRKSGDVNTLSSKLKQQCGNCLYPGAATDARKLFLFIAAMTTFVIIPAVMIQHQWKQCLFEAVTFVVMDF